ncbi:HEAT repeat domain-containing protein [Melittangium boletus]|uniref:HEAT repeat domain-containing protein n=1 Tax=Melittangium boletus TaxID=83453 RepID=UPI003DA34C67
MRPIPASASGRPLSLPPAPRVLLGALAAWLALAPTQAPSAQEPASPPSQDVPRQDDGAPLGTEAMKELVVLAQSPDAAEAQRIRAIEVLALVTPPEATEHLAQLLRTPSLPPALRLTAMASLQRRVGVDALPALLPVLDDDNPQVRAPTARAIGRMGGATARGALEQRLAQEEQPEVREALQQALSDVEP